MLSSARNCSELINTQLYLFPATQAVICKVGLNTSRSDKRTNFISQPKSLEPPPQLHSDISKTVKRAGALFTSLQRDRVRNVGRDSSVGTATRYGLEGPGIESWWGRDFQHPSRPALGPTHPPVQWVPGHSRG